MNAEEFGRLRALAEAGIHNQTFVEAVPALLDEVDRLTEALLAAERQAIGYRSEMERELARAERAEADLADEKRRHAELRAGVEALADEWTDWRTWEGSAGQRVRALLSDTTTGRCTCSPAEVENGICVLCGKPFPVGGSV